MGIEFEIVMKKLDDSIKFSKETLIRMEEVQERTSKIFSWVLIIQYITLVINVVNIFIMIIRTAK